MGENKPIEINRCHKRLWQCQTWIGGKAEMRPRKSTKIQHTARLYTFTRAVHTLKNSGKIKCTAMHRATGWQRGEQRTRCMRDRIQCMCKLANKNQLDCAHPISVDVMVTTETGTNSTRLLLKLSECNGSHYRISLNHVQSSTLSDPPHSSLYSPRPVTALQQLFRRHPKPHITTVAIDSSRRPAISSQHGRRCRRPASTSPRRPCHNRPSTACTNPARASNSLQITRLFRKPTHALRATPASHTPQILPAALS